jgi:hypothetical protein
MRQKMYMFLFMVFLIVPFLTTAQNLVLEDYSHTGSMLNSLVAKDSSSAEFVNGTRVYVLRKDGLYRFNATITSYQGKNIVFTTDPNDLGYGQGGLNPECYGVLSSSNKLPGNFITQQNGGKIELHNINVSDYLAGDASRSGSDSLAGYQQGGLLSIGTAGGVGRIIVDGCGLHGVNGNLIRTDGVTDTVIITNTIFADMGNVFPSNFGAGKGIDLRNIDVQYCKLQNCTFVNAQDRIIRHYQSKNPIHNFIFDHNTVVNCMGYHGFLSLGKVDSTGSGILQITNNLFVDHFALGADTAYIRQVEFSDPGETDALNNQPRIVWVMTNKNNAAVWNIQKNYYVITDSGAAMLSLSAANGYIPRAYIGKEDPFLTLNMNRVLALQGKDTTATFTKLSNISMISIPPLMSTMLRWFYTPRTTSMTLSGTYENPNFYGQGMPISKSYSITTHGDGKEKNGSDANYTASKIVTGIYALDYNRKSLEWYALYPYESFLGTGNVVNCSYLANIDLSAAGTDGQRIGDTRWQCYGALTGVDNTASLSPFKFSLDQNYPNPFNPSTSITYEVGKAGFVSVKVYDLLGREVATLVNQFKEAGSYPATWNAANFGSGVYFYKMQSGSFTATKKMILMK